MPTEFDHFIADSRRFFAALARNNSRDWFAQNKPLYDEKLKVPAQMLLDTLAPRIGAMLDQPVAVKLFRPHRDVRFSKDKSPYKLHLHMLLSPQGNGTQPVYFFGISADYVTAGAGIRGFDKAQQAAWRAFASEREGSALQARIDTAIKAGATLSPPELKRIPSPFDKEHPNGALLRRKSLILHKDIATQAAQGTLPDAIMDAFHLFDPIMDDLRAFV